MSQSSINGGGEVVLYEAPDGQIRLDVRLEQDTVWLTQAQMAELFGRERSVITKHIGGVFRERELEAKSVCANFAHTAEDNLLEDGDGIETNFTEFVVEDTALAWIESLGDAGGSYCQKCNN